MRVRHVIDGDSLEHWTLPDRETQGARTVRRALVVLPGVWRVEVAVERFAAAGL